MITVCMTSWKGRIENIKETIDSILNQSLRPDKFYLTLSSDEFIDKKIPKYLEDIDGEIFEINWMKENTKTMKKIFPILKFLNDDDIIINVDDDIIFDKDFIQSRIDDFHYYDSNYAISSESRFNAFGTYFVGPGSLLTKRMLNGFDIFVNNDVINTYEDDWVYSFLLILNGYKMKLCSKYRTTDYNLINQETAAKKLGIYNTMNTSIVLQKRVIELFGQTIAEISRNNLKMFKN